VAHAATGPLIPGGEWGDATWRVIVVVDRR
jgi:hypothetical protein